MVNAAQPLTLQMKCVCAVLIDTTVKFEALMQTKKENNNSTEYIQFVVYLVNDG